MDYEKKYNEVLERAKSIKDSIIASHNKESARYYTGFIDNIFPELKESEDEKIRKWLYDIVNNGDFLGERPCETDRILAYLEKQKESQPLMRDGEIEDKKRDIVAAIRKHYPADYAEYLTSFLKGLSPEDNSEDEYGQKMLGIAYKLMYEHIPENLRTQEFWDSLKFMREYTGKVAIIHSCEQNPAEWSDTDMKEARNDLISVCRDWECGKQTTLLPIVAIRARYFLEHLVESQKPAEWSEEDEGMLNCIIATLCEESHGGREVNDKMVAWLDNRLRTLRPQPHWKPSEEQMISLWQASIYYKSGKIKITGEQLESLYNDLQKL